MKLDEARFAVLFHVNGKHADWLDRVALQPASGGTSVKN
jgi:hypothetical protein